MASRRKLVVCGLIITVSLLSVLLHSRHGSGKVTDYDVAIQHGSPLHSLGSGRDLGRDKENLEMVREGKYIPTRRVVHLDLKGSPPLISYLQTLIPILAGAGATDLLIEWEDMFPYTGHLVNISARNAYTRAEVSQLLQTAKEQGLGVIPLVQTFGHLEFVLKLEQFKHIREETPYPQALCPSRDDSEQLVKSMLTQIMEVHSEATHVHIGCDEVFQLGQCSKCQDRLSALNDKSTGNSYYDNRYLFLSHVRKVGSLVDRAGKIPLIWDDMLRSIPISDIQESGIGEIVEPMVWVYIEDIDRFVDSLTWRMYAQVFRGVWTASAFKGAFGEKEYIPDMYRHLQNQLSWLQVMQRESSTPEYPVHFRGIALTGWSRYDHFAVLCEILPVSIPSLVSSLLVVSLGSLQLPVSRRIHAVLRCTNQKLLITMEELRRNPHQWELYRCDFPGLKAFSALSTYNMHRTEVDELYSKVKDESAWMTDWNVRRSFSSPWRVQEIMRGAAYLPGAVRELEDQIQRGFTPFLDTASITEWREQHITPLATRLRELADISDKLTKVSVWPRRPV